MSDLRKQLDELRAQLAMLRSPQSDAEYIREHFAAPEFDAQREQVVEALLERGQYSFTCVMPDDEENTRPSHFIVYWTDRTQPLICMRISYTNHWRRDMNAGSGRESIASLAARSVDDAPAPIVEATPVPMAAPVPEPDVSAAPSAETAEAIEAARLQAKIDELRASLTVNEAQQRALDADPPPSPHADEPRRRSALSWAEQMARTRF